MRYTCHELLNPRWSETPVFESHVSDSTAVLWSNMSYYDSQVLKCLQTVTDEAHACLSHQKYHNVWLNQVIRKSLRVIREAGFESREELRAYTEIWRTFYTPVKPYLCYNANKPLMCAVTYHISLVSRWTLLPGSTRPCPYRYWHSQNPKSWHVHLRSHTHSWQQDRCARCHSGEQQTSLTGAAWA